MSSRWLCRIIGHNDRSYPYPGSGDGGGRYLLCHRCRRERELISRPPPSAVLSLGQAG